jgi:hypothetical protein
MLIANRSSVFAAAALAAALSIFSSYASAISTQSSLFADSSVGFNQNSAAGNDELSSQFSTDGTSTSASVTDQTFTGMDGNGVTQTMTFSGVSQSTASFGGLHVYTSGTVTNNYYNAANPKADDGSGTYNLAGGSPDGLYSLGIADFTDTLQYGGALQAGYQARYVFHVDGTNSGDGTLADMGVTIAGNPAEDFFASDSGFISTDWATQTYAINGTTPQTIQVQFSNQFTMNNIDYPDGATISGTSDFSGTLTLEAIDVVDANGNPVSGVTVSSESGTSYPIPEPTALGLLLPAFLALIRRRPQG